MDFLSVFGGVGNLYQFATKAEVVENSILTYHR